MKESINLNISGMTCSSCVLHIESDLKAVDGIEDAVVNLPLKSGKVIFDNAKISSQDIIKIIKKSGYEADLVEQKSNHVNSNKSHHSNSDDSKKVQQKFIQLSVSSFLSVLILILAFVWNIKNGMEIMMVLSLIIILYSGREFFQKGIPDLFKGRPAMDTLVALGIGSAFLYSSYLTLFQPNGEEYFMDVALITTFILMGRFLEAKAKARAGDAIKKLLELSAKVAHRISNNGDIEDVPIEDLKINDVLIVKPGEKIPTDGYIIEGGAAIDESMITGESIPTDKVEGDKVIGATLNGNTSFKLKVTKIGSETVLSQIIKLVEQAQMTKAPIQKLVDLVAGYFVWGVIIIAILTFFGWSIFSNDFSINPLIPTVAVLTIACPCALGLATPISIVVGSGKGAQLGILIKKPESLEKMHKITAIAFDKTGTITKGHPEVQEFKLLNNSDEKIHEIALALENHSEHPLAKSIISFANSLNINSKNIEVKDFKANTGLGLSGRVKDNHYYFGSSKYMKELNRLNSYEDNKEIEKMQNNGYTVLCLANEENILAIYGVQDGIKESSPEAIKEFHNLGIKTIMITGDNEKTANKIAKEVGIYEVYASVTPDKKSNIISDLQKEGYFVAMAGDGINDSPAIAKADVGIAMGTGTDVAIETGDIVLVKGDIYKALEAIELSRSTLVNIKQNLFWAFIYNTIGLPLAAFGFLTPAFSAGAMALSSISVVLNSLRLKRFKVK